MTKVEFHKIGQVDESKLAFAVICSEYESKWIWVKHKKRDTWEIPGGKRDANEDILSAAKRELTEETNAIDFELTAVCEYSVTKDGITTFGRLYYAKVKRLNNNLDFEIEKIQYFDKLPEAMTYPAIQPYLLEKVINWKLETNNIKKNIGLIS